MLNSAPPFEFPGQTGTYRGKVRDVYYLGDKVLVVSSDRISAFDHILPRPIPHKGAVLNGIAAFFLDATSGIVPNWLEATPAANAAYGLNCKPIQLEMVIRGHLAGHAWRTYNSGKRELCGVTLPDGMRESDAFPEPIITPATKAVEGHDEDISRAEIIAQQIVSEDVLAQLEAYTRALFARGQQMAKERGLLLVDTKYEFGVHEDKIYLIDEIHTPDSSRYYVAEGFEQRQASQLSQKQLSKEFVREWLMENGFQGLEGQQMPTMPDDFVALVSQRYIELYEQLTQQKFELRPPVSASDLEVNLTAFLKQQ